MHFTITQEKQAAKPQELEMLRPADRKFQAPKMGNRIGPGNWKRLNSRENQRRTQKDPQTGQKIHNENSQNNKYTVCR